MTVSTVFRAMNQSKKKKTDYNTHTLHCVMLITPKNKH